MGYRKISSGLYVDDSTTSFDDVNPLSANPEKWSNTLKQFVGNLPTNCLSMFDHFMNLALKGLMMHIIFMKLPNLVYKREVSIYENGSQTMRLCSIALMNMKSITNHQMIITKCWDLIGIIKMMNLSLILVK